MPGAASSESAAPTRRCAVRDWDFERGGQRLDRLQRPGIRARIDAGDRLRPQPMWQ
jgi:hypothetical protein